MVVIKPKQYVSYEPLFVEAEFDVKNNKPKLHTLDEYLIPTFAQVNDETVINFTTNAFQLNYEKIEVYVVTLNTDGLVERSSKIGTLYPHSVLSICYNFSKKEKSGRFHKVLYLKYILYHSSGKQVEKNDFKFRMLSKDTIQEVKAHPLEKVFQKDNLEIINSSRNQTRFSAMMIQRTFFKKNKKKNNRKGNSAPIQKNKRMKNQPPKIKCTMNPSVKPSLIAQESKLNEDDPIFKMLFENTDSNSNALWLNQGG